MDSEQEETRILISGHMSEDWQGDADKTVDSVIIFCLFTLCYVTPICLPSQSET